MRRYRPVSAVVFAIVVSALVGGLFGRRALAIDDTSPSTTRRSRPRLSAIESNYVDKVDSDRLVYSAIRGHAGDAGSAFELLRSARSTRRCASGRKAATTASASRFRPCDGDITAMVVFEGSPAYKAGMRRGDVIAKIADETAKGWTTEQAMLKLRGPKGTPVQIEISRRGLSTSPSRSSSSRDEVHILTVPAHFMIDATTGYVQLQDFGENTDREIKQALRDLTSKGMRRLLLDIRGNPGGPLDQAIKVSNEFLPRGRMIVYTRGRISNSDQDYRGTEDGAFQDVPMVVLANRNSASASEIVTRRAAGSRSRVRRRRDDVWQSARAVGLPHQLRRGPGADDRALLHAERPAHSAAVGRDLRRVSELLDARSGREPAAQPAKI